LTGTQHSLIGKGVYPLRQKTYVNPRVFLIGPDINCSSQMKITPKLNNLVDRQAPEKKPSKEKQGEQSSQESFEDEESGKRRSVTRGPNRRDTWQWRSSIGGELT